MELLWLAAGIAIAFIVGIGCGMSWQHKRSEAYIKRLEKQLAERRKPMRVIVQPDFEIDWGEDTFDMDELQMRQTGSHQ